VIVPDFQLSLAIGKEGQNARLAAKLTSWKIDIKSETQADNNREEIERLVREEIGFKTDEEPVDEEVIGEQTEPGNPAEEYNDFEEPMTAGEDETDAAQNDYPDESREEIPETIEDDDDEEEEEEIVVKKKTKKNKTAPKISRADLEDDLTEDDHYFFSDVLGETEPKAADQNREPVKTENTEAGGGFTIGQLLGEELLKTSKKGAKKKGDK
jgi:hypothetical protein